MPPNRLAKLDLRSASRDQSHRRSGKSSQQQQRHPQSTSTTKATTSMKRQTSSTFGRARGSSSKSLSSSSSSSVVAKGNNMQGLENVDPQEQFKQQPRSTDKVSWAAAASAAPAKLSPPSVAPAVAPPIPLSFVQFQAMRRDERTGNGEITRKKSGGYETYAAAARSSLDSDASLGSSGNGSKEGSKKTSLQEQQPKPMTFDEFRDMKRLLTNDNESGSDSNIRAVEKQKLQQQQQQKKKKKASIGKQQAGDILHEKKTQDPTVTQGSFKTKQKQPPPKTKSSAKQRRQYGANTTPAANTITVTAADAGTRTVNSAPVKEANAKTSTAAIITSRHDLKHLKSKLNPDPQLKEVAAASTTAEGSTSKKSKKEGVAKKDNSIKKKKQLHLPPVFEGFPDSAKTNRNPGGKETCSPATVDDGNGHSLGREGRYTVTTYGIPVAMSTLTEEDAMVAAAHSQHHYHPTTTVDVPPRIAASGIADIAALSLSPSNPDKLHAADTLLNNDDDKARRHSVAITAIDEAQQLLDTIATSSIVEKEEAVVIPYCEASVASTVSALPGGMPSLLVIPNDWEEQAGFDGAPNQPERNSGIDDGQHNHHHVNAEYSGEEENDPRNASMRVICPYSNEDLSKEEIDSFEEDVLGNTRPEGDDPIDGSPKRPIFRIATAEDDDGDNGGTISETEEEPSPVAAIENPPLNGETASSFIDSGNTNSEGSDIGLDREEKYSNFGATPVSNRDDDHDHNQWGVGGVDSMAATNPFYIKKEDEPLWPSMNFEGVMFDKNSDVVLPVTEDDDYCKEKGNTKLPRHGPMLATVSTQHDQANKKPEQPERRELKGRFIIIRIKKKVKKIPKSISRVPKAMKRLFFLPFGGSKSKSNSATNNTGNCIVISPPPGSNTNSFHMPESPCSVSVVSLPSSVVTHSNGTATIIGAVPAKSNLFSPTTPAVDRLLYGTVNYGGGGSGRSVADNDGDSTVNMPPPPPKGLFFPSVESVSSLLDEEDAVSFLAEAMKHVQSNDGDDDGDGEESVLLFIVPGTDEDGESVSAEQISQIVGSVASNTPRSYTSKEGHVQEEVVDDDNDDTLCFNRMSNDLASLFAGKSGSSVHQDTPIQIMDADEVEGGYILTPIESRNKNTPNVFRSSTGEAGGNLLLGSALDSDDEDEDDTLLYHDGCTAIQQTSTFDHTIATVDEEDPKDLSPAIDDDAQMFLKNGKEDIDSQNLSASSLQITATSSTLSPSNMSAQSSQGAHTMFLDNEKQDIDSPESDTPLIQSTTNSDKTSPSNASDQPPKSKLQRKGMSPKIKSVPKSASKTRSRRSRGGLVKNRISDIERLSVGGSSSSDDSSYRYKSHPQQRQRHRTSVGSGRSSSSISTTHYIRSVPIGVAKTYSRDSNESCGINSAGGGTRWSFGGNNLGYAKSFGSENEEGVSYAKKYTETLEM